MMSKHSLARGHHTKARSATAVTVLVVTGRCVWSARVDDQRARPLRRPAPAARTCAAAPRGRAPDLCTRQSAAPIRTTFFATSALCRTNFLPSRTRSRPKSRAFLRQSRPHVRQQRNQPLFICKQSTGSAHRRKSPRRRAESCDGSLDRTGRSRCPTRRATITRSLSRVVMIGDCARVDSS